MNEIRRQYEVQSVTIPAGTAVSSAVRIEAHIIGAFQTPAAFTGTKITIEVSVDGVTWGVLKDAGGTAKADYTVANSTPFLIHSEAFGFANLRFKSDQNEGAARTLLVGLKG